MQDCAGSFVTSLVGASPDPAAIAHGRTLAELLEKSLADLVTPEDAGRVPEWIEQLLSDGALRCDAGHARKDGSRFPVEVVARAVSVDGRRFALVFNRDSSARVELQVALADGNQRHELAVQASGVGLWDWDLETSQVFFGDEWKAQLGYAPDEFPSSYEEWEQRLHPDDRAATLASLQSFLDGRSDR
ncbi:MAG: PAS domain S-box protein [Planctomycetes bacterium]|nr:PAS domain S-box protein [Planctomycetota bacterium]